MNDLEFKALSNKFHIPDKVHGFWKISKSDLQKLKAETEARFLAKPPVTKETTKVTKQQSRKQYIQELEAKERSGKKSQAKKLGKTLSFKEMDK